MSCASIKAMVISIANVDGGYLASGFQRKHIFGHKMQRPKNLDDFSQCVKVLPDRTIIFCVECDNWHSVEIEAMARIEIRHNGIKTIEIDEKEIKLCCAVCGSDIEYLLVNNIKSQVIKRFHNVKVIVSKGDKQV